MVGAPIDIETLEEEIGTLKERVRLLEAVIDHFPGGILLTDRSLAVVLCNRQQRELLDYPDTLFEDGNPTLRELFHFNAARGEYGPGDIKDIVAAKMELVRKREPHVFERTRPNGRVIEIRGMPLPGGGFVTSYTDVTDNRRAQATIAELALTDALTGLANRNLLKERVGQAMARAERGAGFALHYIDLDSFKPINDKHGHEAGDQVLTTVGERLRNNVRLTDTVARIGGDEFVILQCDVNEAGDAAEMAWRIAAAINEPIALDCGAQKVGASIGIVTWDETVSDMDELLRRADQALYECKRSGKNQFRLWSRPAGG